MNHRQAWDLIPWFANGSAPEMRREHMQRHLEECAACREELAAQRAIMQAMKTRPLVENMPHASLQKLMARIDADPAPPRQQPEPRARSPRVVHWLAAAVVMQALLLGVLALVMIDSRRGGESAEFRTVSSAAPAPGAPSVRAVFAPDMTLGELQALLERAHLRIVNGPTPEGVYTLALATARDDPKQALLTLRSHPAARFAEPISP